ncbi:MAG: GxxExxY protein [Alphaproteobacteria bacterium]
MDANTILFKDEIYHITGCAMSVLNALGHGFSEKVYENALAIELNEQNIRFHQQKQFDVFYKNKNIGVYIPDFVIEDKIIVELKTIQKISDLEKGQVLNYLKVTGLEVGLILNFKNSKLEWQRLILSNSR